MATSNDTHPNAPAHAGGPAAARTAGVMGANPPTDKAMNPRVLGTDPPTAKPSISGVIVAGGPLSTKTVAAINEAAPKVPARFRRYIAYADKVKVGGSLAWRANNPGNLRGAPTKIGTVPGASGHFAVFATLEDGRAAQRDLYLNTYGDRTVRAAIDKLTPPSENDTAKYLTDLQNAGVDLDKTIKSQIDTLMPAVQVNEGLIAGIEITRVP